MNITNAESLLREILESTKRMSIRIDRGACGACAFVHVASWFSQDKADGLSEVAQRCLGISHAEAWAFMSGWDDRGDWSSNWFSRFYGQNFNEKQRAWWELGNKLAKEFCPA